MTLETLSRDPATTTIEVERTFDYELVRRIFTNPAVYDHLTDDFSPARANYQPSQNESLVYLTASSDGKLLGAGMFIPRTGICFEVHLAFLPRGWGLAVEAAKVAVSWMFSRTRCRRLVANIPAYNRLTLRMAKKVGFAQFGLNPGSILKDGKLHDQILMGLSKEDRCLVQ